MSELLQLLTMAPHPLPMSMVRVHSVITPADSECDFYCSRCNQELPPSAFYFDKVREQYRSICRECSYKKSGRYLKQKAEK